MNQTINLDVVIIDVREPIEYREGHVPGSINIPFSTMRLEDFNDYNNHTIHLICQTGRRARLTREHLVENGFANVIESETHMEWLSEKLMDTSSRAGWTVDRQFRMTLGLLLVLFFIGYFFFSKWFLIIPGILATGLVFTSIIDRCYMRMGIALLPWNRGK